MDFPQLQNDKVVMQSRANTISKGAGEENPDLTALSTALKRKLGLYDLRKHPSYHVPVVCNSAQRM